MNLLGRREAGGETGEDSSELMEKKGRQDTVHAKPRKHDNYLITHMVTR
jgi:hypothetical protein